MAKLKIFIAAHQGVWLGGYSLVFAHSKEEAERLVNEQVSSFGHDRWVELEEVKFPKEPTVKEIWNGDY